MANRIRFLWEKLRTQLGWSRPLTLLGGLGLALAGLCALGALVRGVEIPPEGDLLETASFNGALGFFVLTMALLAPGAHWTDRGRKVWISSVVLLVLYAYGIETLQAFRGLDPRFSRVAGVPDQIAGGVFFLTALGVMVTFIVLAVKYFRSTAIPLNVAVRYGSAASLVAFGVGIWMSLVTDGRHVPEAGNLLFLHAVGFHGLQAIPLLALLMSWSGTPESLAMRIVHLTGLAWLGACLAIAWQSGTGRSVTETTPATVAAAVLLTGWLVLAVSVARGWLRVPAAA